MCGIVGVADFRPGNGPDAGLLASMTDTLAHRGPDGRCVVRIDTGGTAHLTFGFRRLSIIDLGAGARAYSDESGRIRAICNGEIYNWPEIERDLRARGHRFETNCDTEVLPHLYEEHGLGFVERLNGMFAFAIFDVERQRLVLGRDRAGEKPLYYVDRPGELLFGSEIKALLAHPDVSRDTDLQALTRYLLYGYFPAPHTPFRDIRKLPAGHLLIAEKGQVRVQSYWDLRRFVAVGGTGGAPVVPSEAEATREVGRLLREGVELRLRADVPVGIFFSGGVDSTAIAALATEIKGPGVPTFSLGFEDRDFDESDYARRAAARLRTDHHETIVGEKDLTGALFDVARVLDEPLADASILPTFLLSRFARRSVKVTLGGEGGDELFAGYPTYLGDRLARVYAHAPRAVRALVRRGVGLMRPGFSNVGLEFLLRKFVASAELPDETRHPIWFGAFSPERQRALLSDAALTALRSDGGLDPLAEARAVRQGLAFRHPLDALLLTDFLLYLQDDLLTKIDRASMATSLEVRAPFLHHPLVEYVAGLPASYKLRGTNTKWLLKRALGDRIGQEVVKRRKRGFNIPLARLLVGPLQALVRRAFEPARLEREGLLRPQAVADLWSEHRARRHDHGRLLWNLLMLQLWRSRMEHGGDLLDGGTC